MSTRPATGNQAMLNEKGRLGKNCAPLSASRKDDSDVLECCCCSTPISPTPPTPTTIWYHYVLLSPSVGRWLWHPPAPKVSLEGRGGGERKTWQGVSLLPKRLEHWMASHEPPQGPQRPRRHWCKWSCLPLWEGRGGEPFWT